MVRREGKCEALTFLLRLTGIRAVIRTKAISTPESVHAYSAESDWGAARRC